MNYRDRYGILHHKRVENGDPLTSENGPLFDGTNIALNYINRTLFSDKAYQYINRVRLFSPFCIHSNLLSFFSDPHNEKMRRAGLDCWYIIFKESLLTGTLPKGYWRVTPISERNDFSRDNWSGVFAGLECCERKAKEWGDKKLACRIALLKKSIPIFHKQLDHPRDFLLVLGFKYKWLRPFCMWLPKLAAIISMYQTHKKKGSLAKTDGKIIGLSLCIAFNWKWTLWVMTKLLDKKRIYPMPRNAWHMCTKQKGMKWTWDSFENVFHDYFDDINHPNVVRVKTWEER